jgi:phospholipase A1
MRSAFSIAVAAAVTCAPLVASRLARAAEATDAGANPPPDGGPAPDAAAPTSGMDGGSLLYDLLTFYKDNYFLTGFTKSQEVKFQFSAKFDLWPNESAHAVYLAYSQKALWNAYLNSSPFQENDYNPELFYAFFHHPGRYVAPPGCAFFEERVGFEHESNGLGGTTSRGWDRVYGETRFSCYRRVRGFASATLRVWAPPFGVDAYNPDILNYVGFGELTLALGSDRGQGWLDQWNLSGTVRKGTSASLGVGSVEVDGRWRPPNGDIWRLTLYLYAQLFVGYEEMLLTYNRPVTAFRIGIGLSDISTRSR